MSKVVKHVQAEEDLVDIWLYTHKEWGLEQADKYLDELDAAMDLLARRPLILSRAVRVHTSGADTALRAPSDRLSCPREWHQCGSYSA